MALKFIEDTNEVLAEIKKEKVLVLNFFATWCGPCKMFGPILEEFSKSHPVVKVDIDKNDSLPSTFKVASVPTTIFLKDGVEVDRITGYVPVDLLVEKMQIILKKK